MKIFAAIFVCGCFLSPTTASSQQYPFLTYTTKDGLISNRVRKMYQDSLGRLFFLTYGGLSIYDGERFTNYSTEDGLANELINDVMQMGKDSFWIATNTHAMNCLVHGKIKTIKTANDFYPVVNELYRNKDGKLFAAADEGLFTFESKRFKHLEFTNEGKDVGSYVRRIKALNNELMLVQADAGVANKEPTLFLYNYKLQKIISSVSDIEFGAVSKGNYWVMTANGLRMLDGSELTQNKLQLGSLPASYKNIASWVTAYVFFDRDENFWIASPEGFLAKCDPHGDVIVLRSEKILSEQQPNEIFQDREGILWINFLQNGASKMPSTDVLLYDDFFGMRHISDIASAHGKLIFYDNQSNKISISDSSTRVYFLPGNFSCSGITSTAKGIFCFSGLDIYKLVPQGRSLKPVKIKVDSGHFQYYNTAMEDKYGNYIVSGDKYMTAVIDGRVATSVPINLLADQLTRDSSGNIWVANRGHQIMKFSVHPGTPERYFQLESQYKLAEKINVRAAIFDSLNKLWIGSRDEGLFKATFSGDTISLFQYSKRDGLSDHFVSWLACDNNELWCCSPSGVDKINFKGNSTSIENITGQSNLFRKVAKIVLKGDSAWALTGEGMIIKINQKKNSPINYTPHFYLAYLKKGRDTIQAASSYKFSHVDNNLSFYFAATSFLQETQILYSFRLRGTTDTTWSEPTPNALVSFTNLAPGNYSLQARVSFPARRYAEQSIEIPLVILPPWWKTTWFTILVLIIVVILAYAILKAYVRGKLAKQRIIMERQQAVEKERTRIATDMHDDLGVGLSRIKFLSEIIKLKKHGRQPVEEDISRIGDYADEMIGKMGEIVWALNEKYDSVSGLVAYTRAYAVDYLNHHEIDCNVQIPETFPDHFITGETRRNIFLTVKEALHNVAKHAKARNVNISVSAEKNIVIIMSDDGVGIDIDNIRQFSNGLSNMQKRITEIGGTFEIKNSNGTTVSISVPLEA